jgi:hypothetical protein
MKGMLAGGALLALGTPPWTFAGSPVRKAGQYGLLLGGSRADEAFTRGVRAACAGMAYTDMQTVKLKGGLTAGIDEVSKFLTETRGTRWIAVMDDAGAAIFLELARTLGAGMLAMGMHACSTDHSRLLRHDIASTSSVHSIGGLLASQAIQASDGFSITEGFLQKPAGAVGAVMSWGTPEFSSHRFTGPDAIHVHCSGCSLLESRRLLGLETLEEWIPIPPQACASEPVTWQSKNWVESVGYAVTASALGVHSVRESCASRVFIHQAGNGTRTEPTERFVSFVMDI